MTMQALNMVIEAVVGRGNDRPRLPITMQVFP